MAKKETSKQVGQNYYLTTNKASNPKLGGKVCKGGVISLWLEYYDGYTTNENGNTKPKRKRESLKLYLQNEITNPIIKQTNNEVKRLAEKIRFEREQQFLQQKKGYRLQARTEKTFLQVVNECLNLITKQSSKNIYLHKYNRLKQVIKDNYNINIDNLKIRDITQDHIITYAETLKSECKGVGAKVTFDQTKHFFNYAINKGYININPFNGVKVVGNTNILTKEILSTEEIIMLLNTEYPLKYDDDIKRAFTFSLYTGIRKCDIVELKYSNIDYSNKRIYFEQKKTKGHSNNSYISIPLKDELIKLIGKCPQDKNTLIFPKMPSFATMQRRLNEWIKQANINKHITFHCARHSFACSVLSNGTNIKVVSSLLGHSNIAMTEKYLHTIDKQKEEAINNLPNFKI